MNFSPATKLDFPRKSVNKGLKPRLVWTKYSDLYEFVHPSLDLIFFVFTHWSGMRERSFVIPFRIF